MSIPNSSSLSYLIEIYDQMCQRSTRLILATVVETLGSTYRKAGARILIAEDGQFYGIIAGGCFDGDLREQTLAIFESGQSRELFYDMRAPEDALWGLGLGCNGAVRLFLQPLESTGQDKTITQLREIIASQRDSILATYCSGEQAGQCMRMDMQSTSEDASNKELQTVWSSAFDRKKPRACYEKLADQTQVFFDYIPAQKHLLLIGAGADAGPIVQLAAQMNWRVSLIDHRPANLVHERFPAASSLANVYPSQLLSHLEGKCVDAVVLMTHNIDYDSQYLKPLVQLPCHYLGLLGPKQRADELFHRTGLTPRDFGARLHAPVGLDIGRSNTPESIALSLIAEIHACLHQGSAGFLRNQFN